MHYIGCLAIRSLSLSLCVYYDLYGLILIKLYDRAYELETKPIPALVGVQWSVAKKKFAR